MSALQKELAVAGQNLERSVKRVDVISDVMVKYYKAENLKTTMTNENGEPSFSFHKIVKEVNEQH